MTNIKQFFLWLGLGLAALTGTVTLWAPPAAALPPRPPAPTAAPTPHSSPTTVPLDGAVIILQGEADGPVAPGLWTEVEWRDAQGGWQKVDGWRGAFNEENRVVWWVGPEHLGQGPFRWLVYAAEGSPEVLAASHSFYLPAEAGQTVTVVIALPPFE